jgi:hypothetical protein
MIKLDYVILSSNSSPSFLNFWPLVSRIWRETIGIEPVLVFVYKKKNSLKLIPRLETFGKVIPLRTFSNAPIQNQAKLARWFVASKLDEKWVTVDDIDSFFTSNTYLLGKLEQLDLSRLLGIGSEVYLDDDSDKFPASSLCGHSSQFSEFFSISQDQDFEAFLNRLALIKPIDGKENPYNHPSYFSDESVIRALRQTSPQEIKVIKRDLDFENECIDRLNWPTEIDFERRMINSSVVNLPRPLFENRKKVRYILEKYYPEGYPWIIKRWSFRDNPDLSQNLKSSHPSLLNLLKLLLRL